MNISQFQYWNFETPGGGGALIGESLGFETKSIETLGLVPVS